ncbi:hypothetical protein [Pseudomonas sp. WHRI 8519]|uniref:hypothetical protein n=1 Tax=Pseudomonas sp. WHRI 8519 TaxID=3162567 RepID=UPI0032ED0F0B
MAFPSERKQIITDALRVLDLDEKAKFSAWCLYYFETESVLISYFDMELGPSAKERVIALTRKLWLNDYDLDLLQCDLKFLEALDWDIDAVSESDINASEGVTDYLAAATFAVKGVLTDSENYFHACSENVINRLDYIMSFSESDLGENLVDAKYEKQKVFLALIKPDPLEINWSR